MQDSLIHSEEICIHEGSALTEVISVSLLYFKTHFHSWNFLYNGTWFQRWFFFVYLYYVIYTLVLTPQSIGESRNVIGFHEKREPSIKHMKVCERPNKSVQVLSVRIYKFTWNQMCTFQVIETRSDKLSKFDKWSKWKIAFFNVLIETVHE